MKFEGDSLNTQHAQHRPEQEGEAVFIRDSITDEDPPKEEEEEEAVFTRESIANENPHDARHAQHRPKPRRRRRRILSNEPTC